jgi:hypothetical protein
MNYKIYNGSNDKRLLINLTTSQIISSTDVYYRDWLKAGNTPLQQDNNYKELRKAEYGTWEDQLDMIYHGSWNKHIKEIKRKYSVSTEPLPLPAWVEEERNAVNIEQQII